MQPIPTPHLPGRRALAVSAAAFTAAVVASPLRAGARAQAAERVATPRQITGPFYPVDWSGDADPDLVRVTGAEAEALGKVVHLRGRVLDLAGRPMAGAAIEIWQCDANGLYRHPNDRAGTRDTGFQGRGRMLADQAGRFAFRTIRPVPYPGRTPHIHVLVAAAGQRTPLITQLYVAGEKLNDSDRLFNSVRDPAEREALLLRLEPADAVEPGALLASRDIVLATGG